MLSDIVLLPFKPEHLKRLDAPRNDAALYPALCTPDYLKSLQSAGNAFSAWVKSGLLGCGGIGMRPDGWPEAWMIGSSLIDCHKIGFHRVVKRTINEIMAREKWDYVLASSKSDDFKACRWLKALGFKQHGFVYAYGTEYIRFMKGF